MANIIICHLCGEEVYTGRMDRHLEKDHPPVIPFFVAELTYGWESHDVYYETARVSVECSMDAFGFAEAESEVRDIADTLLADDDEWSGWYRIETIERVRV